MEFTAHIMRQLEHGENSLSRTDPLCKTNRRSERSLGSFGACGTMPMNMRSLTGLPLLGCPKRRKSASRQNQRIQEGAPTLMSRRAALSLLGSALVAPPILNSTPGGREGIGGRNLSNPELAPAKF